MSAMLTKKTPQKNTFLHRTPPAAASDINRCVFGTLSDIIIEVFSKLFEFAHCFTAFIVVFGQDSHCWICYWYGSCVFSFNFYSLLELQRNKNIAQ